MSTPSDTPHNDHDAYWKTGFDTFLQDFVLLLAPDVHAAVDWARGFVARTIELFPETPESVVRKREPDRVYELSLLAGGKTVVFLHFEFQSFADRDFEERMFHYHLRLLLHFRHPIVSIALLADDTPWFRPSEYRSVAFDVELRLQFRVFKLLEHAAKRDEFLCSGNPAKVLAAIKLIDLFVKDPTERVNEMLRVLRTLVRIVRDHGLAKELTRFLLQGIILPRPHLEDFRCRVLAAEKELHMPFVTIFEQEAEARGISLGEARGISLGEARGEARAILTFLTARFQRVPEEIASRLREITDLERLDSLTLLAANTASVEDFAKGLE